MTNSLVRFWNKFEPSAPYIHPDDRTALSPSSKDKYFHDGSKNFNHFVMSSRFGDFSESRFDLSLLPQPYAGDLKRAEIVILLLNPGFGFTDYYGEDRMAGFTQRLEENLRQSFHSQEYPFLWLDPGLCWHGGFVWWEKKLRPVLTEIAKKYFKENYRLAMHDLAKRLACIELFPYHSPRFGAHSIETLLPSVKAAQTYVKDVLQSEAIAGKKLVIITRRIKSWEGLKKCENIVTYNAGQARGASLGPQSDGWKNILKWYESHRPSRQPLK